MNRSGDVGNVQKVITGDESWMYGFDIETKVQSSRFATIEEIREKWKQEAGLEKMRGVTLKGPR